MKAVKNPALSPEKKMKVDRFIEKPKQSEFDKLECMSGDIAWECGTVVFKQSYFRQVVPFLEGKNDLAEHLLSRASKWSFEGQNTRDLSGIEEDGGNFFFRVQFYRTR